MSKLLRIAVLGGGASAVCLLDALAQREDLPPAHLTVFDGSRQLWRGRPYQPDLDTMRVNAVAQDMSVRAGEPEHLAEWLAARALLVHPHVSFADPVSGTVFMPRAVYGDYLEQSARAALMTLTHRGWQVELVRQFVHSAAPTSTGVVLRTGLGAVHEVDHAVLATGAGPPPDRYSLAGTAGFVGDPYPVADLVNQVGAGDDVGIIGSGLTATDVTLALARHGHRGTITWYSRRGILPAVRQRPIRYQPAHLTVALARTMAAAGEPLTLAAVVTLLAREMAAAGESLSGLRTEIDAVVREDPVVRLRRQLADVDAPSRALRILQQAVPQIGPQLWALLPGAERDLVLTEYDRALMSLCCPMPPGSAATLLSMMDAGRLVVASGLADIDAVDGGFVLTTPRATSRARVVVNAVNSRSNPVTGCAAGLVRSLVDTGLAEPHPRGGVRVEPATSRLTVRGQPEPRLYALGDLAMGSLFFTFGIESLVDRAVDIVTSLHQSLTDRGSLVLLPM